MVFIGAGLLVGSGGNPPPVPNQIGLKELFEGIIRFIIDVCDILLLGLECGYLRR